MELLRFFAISSSSAVFLAIALVVFEPLPEGISNQQAAKIDLFAIKLGRNLCYLGERFGYDGRYGNSIMDNVMGVSAVFFSSPVRYEVNTQDATFANVPVRIHSPTTPSEQPGKSNTMRAIVFYHGGGWVLGTIESQDRMCQKLSVDLNAVCVNVDYRLAPEHIFPAAINDCYAATKYFIQNAKKYKVDPKRVVVMGDSAGGNLAAAVSQRLNNEDFKPLPKLQALVYPALQATDLDTPSYRAMSDGPLLTKEWMAWFYSYYLFGNQEHYDIIFTNNHTHPHVKQNMPLKYMRLEHLPKDSFTEGYKPQPPFTGNIPYWESHKLDRYMHPYFAPLMARGSDMVGLPQTFIITCQYDVLRDDGFHYAARLRKENVSVDLVNLEKCYHGWFDDKRIRDIDTFQEHYGIVYIYLDKNL